MLIWAIVFAFAILIAPFIALFAWGHILYVLKNVWLITAYILTIVGIILWGFQHLFSLMEDSTFWVFLLLLIYINRIMIPRITRDYNNALLLFNASAIPIFIYLAYPIITDGAYFMRYEFHDFPRYGLASFVFFSGLLLPFVAWRYPLQTDGKRKNDYQRDRTIYFLLGAIVLAMLTGNFIFQIRYEFMCTSLSVTSLPLTLQFLKSNELNR